MFFIGLFCGWASAILAIIIMLYWPEAADQIDDDGDNW